ncbi:MAG TPA: hypothetical protein VIY47_08865 [Ignavibacteriaceae bacterium]
MKLEIKSIALLLMIAGITTTLSCKKDKDINTAKTKTELLTTGTWKYTASTINPAYDYYSDGILATNIFTIMKSCEKDDFETYKTNGMWEYNEGPTKCDPSYPQVFSESWSFTANETKLLLGTGENTILELTATTLKLRFTFEDAGVIYTAEDTYGH